MRLLDVLSVAELCQDLARHAWSTMHIAFPCNRTRMTNDRAHLSPPMTHQQSSGGGGDSDSEEEEPSWELPDHLKEYRCVWMGGWLGLDGWMDGWMDGWGGVGLSSEVG